MKIPQSIIGSSCEELVERWGIHPELAVKLGFMARHFEQRTGAGLRIISGFRTLDEQRALEQEGRPAAPDHLSTHRSCPATGADLQPELAVTTSVKVLFGESAFWAGLRWGGGSPTVDGIPSDWNHVDLGPRNA